MSAESERLKSEVERNRAERRKLLFEAIEIRHSLRRPWYQRQYIIQTVLGGIVAAGLLAAWIATHLTPILSQEVELAQLKNKKLAMENKLEALRNEEEKRDLIKAKRSAESRAIKLVSELERLSREYTTLAALPEILQNDRDRFQELSERSSEHSRRWQDDDFLFSVARARLDSYAGTTIEFPATIKSRLNLHNFTGDDEVLQKMRLEYLRTVLLILDEHVDHESAIAVWLAGVDQHNRSLQLKSGGPHINQQHLEEIDIVHSLLTERVLELPTDETTAQILSWLDIHHHNMREMRE